MNEKNIHSNINNYIPIYLVNCDSKYEVENICRLFFPYCKFEFYKTDSNCDGYNSFICIKLNNKYNNIIINVSVNINGTKSKKSSTILSYNLDKYSLDLELSSLIFDILSKITGLSPKWGIITGIRPAKLFRSLLNQHGIEYSIKYFKDRLYVSDEKINLVAQVCKEEEKTLNLSKTNSFSLYISIPFCPSRCSYCSFVSHSVEKSEKLIPIYLDLLIQELKYTSKITRDFGLTLETVYIGGGTPTILSPEQLILLVEAINKNFDMTVCREFTIESGRPDTLNIERLEILSKINKLRISINPQTFNNDVLNNIGRKHTDKDVIYAFEMARKLGFENINMDLISGLPGDVYESFCKTIDKTISLSPESITLHTLSIKKAANINQFSDFNHSSIKLVDKMINYAYKSFTNSGYIPYYLYRQSKMVCNAENTGWSKPEAQGLYNIFIMDEIHSIISCGAGGVTKLKNPFNSNIERIFNFKFVYEYISRFNEIVYRKGKVKNFYEKL